MFKFLVYVPREGAPTLCEGGVYSDDAAMLASVNDYSGNTFLDGRATCESLNLRAEFSRKAPYELRDSLDGCDASDADVISSLAEWQFAAILDSAIGQDKGLSACAAILDSAIGQDKGLSACAAIYRERGRRVVLEALPGFVLFNAEGLDGRTTESARTAQEMAGEQDSVWHKAEGQRPYELDAVRLQALADMEAGRDLMGRGFTGDAGLGLLAEGIAAAFGRDVPDTLARELGRLHRNFASRSDLETANGAIAGLGDRLMDLSASVSEWKAEAKTQDKARGAAVRETEKLRGEKMRVEHERDEMEKRYREESSRCETLRKRKKELETLIDELNATIDSCRAQREAAESRYRAESLACNELRNMRVTLESNMAAYRSQRDANGAEAVELRRVADCMEIAYKAEKAAHESLDRATRPLMVGLGGLTLSMLPAGAYGGALAAAYAEARYAFTVATPGERSVAFMDKGK